MLFPAIDIATDVQYQECITSILVLLILMISDTVLQTCWTTGNSCYDSRSEICAVDGAS